MDLLLMLSSKELELKDFLPTMFRCLVTEGIDEPSELYGCTSRNITISNDEKHEWF